ncbi:MAG: DUF6249 domain-containing protein [Woeseia sp.]
MVEELIPIVMFLSIALVLGLFYWFRYLARREMQRTVRIALERGNELSPELLDRLGEPRKSAGGDLRRSLIAIAIGLGVGLFGVALGEEDAVRPLFAASLLPLFIGIAYFILWRINPDRNAS